MLRLGSLLMMILLTAPMVRDCCLPVAHVLPCHESKQRDDVTCFTTLQAIAETKTALAASSLDHRDAIADDAIFVVLTQTRRALGRVRLAPTLASDIYLRTCALLI
jgi:hypothetical protein